MILLAIVSLIGSGYLMYCSIDYGYFLIHLSLLTLILGTIFTFIKFTGYEIVSTWGGIVMDVMPASLPMAVTFFLGYLVFGFLATNVASENWLRFFCGSPVANYKDPGGFLGFCYTLSNIWGAIMVIVAAIIWLVPTLMFCLDKSIKKHFRYIIGGIAIVALCMFIGRYGYTIINYRLTNITNKDFAKVAEDRKDEVYDYFEKRLKEESNVEFISAECLGCGGHMDFVQNGVDVYAFYLVDASYTDVDPETNEERTTEFNYITGVWIGENCKKTLKGEYTYYEDTEVCGAILKEQRFDEFYLSETGVVIPLFGAKEDGEIKPYVEEQSNYPYVRFVDITPELYQKLTIKSEL